MRDVYILGAGMTAVGKHIDSSPDTFGCEAVTKALESAQLDIKEIGALYTGNMMSGILCNQQMLAPLIANRAGLPFVETITTEAACGSGAAAARLGYMAIRSGAHNAVVISGAEQMSHCETEQVTQTLATASHWPTEGSQGESFLSLNAKLMQAYMDHYQVSAEQFAPFSINAHRNAFTNDCAMLHKLIDQKTYNDSRFIVNPVRLFDAPPICDGAAALILCNEAIAKSAIAEGRPVIKIIASTASSDQLALCNRKSLVDLEGARLSSQAAYTQAGLNPADIDLFELHDAYSIISVLSLEAAGFADPGCAIRLGEEGKIALDGDIPISTFGGLKARGHPVGATGAYQLVECFLQLTDRAGKNQVKNARTAMAQNFGGTGSSIFTHILQRV